MFSRELHVLSRRWRSGNCPFALALAHFHFPETLAQMSPLNPVQATVISLYVGFFLFLFSLSPHSISRASTPPKPPLLTHHTHQAPTSPALNCRRRQLCQRVLVLVSFPIHPQNSIYHFIEGSYLTTSIPQPPHLSQPALLVPTPSLPHTFTLRPSAPLTLYRLPRRRRSHLPFS